MSKTAWLPPLILIASSLILAIELRSSFSLFVLAVDLLWILSWYFSKSKIPTAVGKAPLSDLISGLLLMVGIFFILSSMTEEDMGSLAPRNLRGLFSVIPIILLATYTIRRKKYHAE